MVNATAATRPGGPGASGAAPAAAAPGDAPGGAALDDYNPFDKSKQQTTSGGSSGDGGNPAVMKAEEARPPPDAPPSYSASAQQQITTADFQVKYHTILHHCWGASRGNESGFFTVSFFSLSVPLLSLINAVDPGIGSYRSCRYRHKELNLLPFRVV